MKPIILKRHNAKSWKFEYDNNELAFVYKARKHMYVLIINGTYFGSGTPHVWVGKRSITDNGCAFWHGVTNEVKAKSIKVIGGTIVFDKVKHKKP